MIKTVEEFCMMVKKAPDFPGVFRVSLIIEKKESNFINLLLAFCKRYMHNIMLVADEMEDEHLLRQLSTSFLGQRYIYWVTGKQITLKMNNILTDYQGPHCVITIITQEIKEVIPSTSHILVDVPNKIDRDQYQRLFLHLYGHRAKDAISKGGDKFSQLLFAKNRHITINEAVMLMRYYALLKTESLEVQQDFMVLWKEEALNTIFSMFKLSELFFNQDYQEFFTYWSLHKHIQSFDSWISFWSNQLFNAGIFVHLVQDKGYQYAKGQVKLLPFSFLKKSWQQYRFEQLVAAHNALYRLDLHGKLNFAHLESLEIWYHKFLLKRF